jgi:HEAT repeat protein
MTEKTFEQWLDDLESMNIETQRIALFELAKLEDSRVPTILISALKDKNANIRLGALVAILGRHAIGNNYVARRILETDLYIEPLIELLGSEKDAVNIQWAIVLLGLGSGKLAFDAIIPFLEHPDQFTRSSGVRALGEMASIEGIPYLLKALQDADPYVRWAAVHALARFDDARAIQGLISALTDRGRLYPRHIETVIETCIGEVTWTILKKKSNQVLSQLIQSFNNRSENVLLRARIAAMLIEYDDNRGIDIVVDTLDKMLAHEVTMWKTSVSAVVKENQIQAIETLSKEAEKSDNPWVWAGAKTAIMKISIVNGLAVPEAERSQFLQDSQYYFRVASKEQFNRLRLRTK